MNLNPTGCIKRMYIIRVGTLEMPDIAGLLPGTRDHYPVSMPVYCYLLEHEKGRVLVDTGVANEGPAVVQPDQYIVKQLEKLGLTPDDIDYVVLTHMHVDHAAFMSEFKNSTFIIRREELKMAWWPDHFEGGYVYSQYCDTRDCSFIQPRDNETFDVFGDGSIQLIDTRGHSRGHQSVLVNLKNDGHFVIVGDAAYFERNLNEFLLPSICTSSVDAEKALCLLRHLRDCEWTLLMGHDDKQADNQYRKGPPGLS